MFIVKSDRPSPNNPPQFGLAGVILANLKARMEQAN